MVVGADGVLPLPWQAAQLRATLARQRAHALLVHAGAAAGALEFSLALAQAWLCEAPPTPSAVRPCGRCASCRLVQAHIHPDLLLLVPEVQRQALSWPLQIDKPESAEGDAESAKARKKPSRQIRIDEVRFAIDWIVTTSARGMAKVLLVHPAPQLNPQAANALLKTLEEPPRGARIVLTAGDPEHLLPTIRSRCQRMALSTPEESVALHWLAGQGVDDAAVLLAAASGRPLEALKLHRAGVGAAAWAMLPRAVTRGDASALAGWPVPRAVDALMRLCHDAMRLAAGGLPVYFPAGVLPAGADAMRLTAWHRTLSRASRHDEHPWNEGLLIESLVIEGARALIPAASALPAARPGKPRMDTLPA